MSVCGEWVRLVCVMVSVCGEGVLSVFGEGRGWGVGVGGCSETMGTPRQNRGMRDAKVFQQCY